MLLKDKGDFKRGIDLEYFSFPLLGECVLSFDDVMIVVYVYSDLEYFFGGDVLEENEFISMI